MENKFRYIIKDISYTTLYAIYKHRYKYEDKYIERAIATYLDKATFMVYNSMRKLIKKYDKIKFIAPVILRIICEASNSNIYPQTASYDMILNIIIHRLYYLIEQTNKELIE